MHFDGGFGANLSVFSVGAFVGCSVRAARTSNVLLAITSNPAESIGRQLLLMVNSRIGASA